jgi:hypothetical protein
VPPFKWTRSRETGHVALTVHKWGFAPVAATEPPLGQRFAHQGAVVVTKTKTTKNRPKMTIGGVRKTDLSVPKPSSELPRKNIPLSSNAFAARLAAKAATTNRFRSTVPGTRNHAAKEKKTPKIPAPRSDHFPIWMNRILLLALTIRLLRTPGRLEGRQTFSITQFLSQFGVKSWFVAKSSAGSAFATDSTCTSTALGVALPNTQRSDSARRKR